MGVVTRGSRGKRIAMDTSSDARRAFATKLRGRELRHLARLDAWIPASQARIDRLLECLGRAPAGPARRQAERVLGAHETSLALLLESRALILSTIARLPREGAVDHRAGTASGHMPATITRTSGRSAE